MDLHPHVVSSLMVLCGGVFMLLLLQTQIVYADSILPAPNSPRDLMTRVDTARISQTVAEDISHQVSQWATTPDAGKWKNQLDPSEFSEKLRFVNGNISSMISPSLQNELYTNYINTAQYAKDVKTFTGSDFSRLSPPHFRRVYTMMTQKEYDAYCPKAFGAAWGNADGAKVLNRTATRVFAGAHGGVPSDAMVQAKLNQVITQLESGAKNSARKMVVNQVNDATKKTSSDSSNRAVRALDPSTLAEEMFDYFFGDEFSDENIQVSNEDRLHLFEDISNAMDGEGNFHETSAFKSRVEKIGDELSHGWGKLVEKMVTEPLGWLSNFLFNEGRDNIQEHANREQEWGIELMPYLENHITNEDTSFDKENFVQKQFHEMYETWVEQELGDALSDQGIEMTEMVKSEKGIEQLESIRDATAEKIKGMDPKNNAKDLEALQAQFGDIAIDMAKAIDPSIEPNANDHPVDPHPNHGRDDPDVHPDDPYPNDDPHHEL
eukprot:Nk52_evm15s263 gene=Nk52_evmTU15s263